MFDDLLRMLQQARKSESAKKTPIDVCTLGDSDADDWRSINAMSRLLNAQEEEIARKKKICRARLDIFWDKVRERHGLLKVGAVQVGERNGHLILQKMVCTAKMGVCDEDCDRCMNAEEEG